MRKILDFHIHSKYSRATSKNFDLAEMYKWSKIKGVDIISAADFTHPGWFKILEQNLVEHQPGSGLYRYKDQAKDVLFIISTEISCIYSQGGKTRRVHLCLLAPNLQVAKKINENLSARGAKLASDGRPILGMSAKNILEMILEIDERIMLIPAHAWTPWFAVFGSKSGFDSLEECFEDLTPYVQAIETGLSSDPLMNWRLSKLDNITLVSNSDAHSGPRIGREANVLDLHDITFDEIREIINAKDKKRFLYTVEFYPEEGMYHFDGHRDCQFSCSPQESAKKHKNICPLCKKPLTLGVLNQVERLADRAEQKIDTSFHIPYKNIVPLPEIIADYYGVNRNSKKVEKLYLEIIAKAGNEFVVTLDLNEEELKKIMPTSLTAGIMKMRVREMQVLPGFDGQYGQVKIFSELDRQKSKIIAPQETLF
jgi:uncharacterized protein (TIGR00375 family)